MWFFKKEEIWEIGPFQLENITMNVASFLVLDMRRQLLSTADEAQLGRFLSSARQINPDLVVDFVSAESADKANPVILICENGKQSKKIARILGRDGYPNVYVLEGGASSLLEYCQTV